MEVLIFMRLALIGCSIFSREIGYAISQSENTIHAFWLEQGLHNTPQKLNETIQETINKIEGMNEKNNSSNSFRKFDAASSTPNCVTCNEVEKKDSFSKSWPNSKNRNFYINFASFDPRKKESHFHISV